MIIEYKKKFNLNKSNYFTTQFRLLNIFHGWHGSLSGSIMFLCYFMCSKLLLSSKKYCREEFRIFGRINEIVIF